MKITAIGDYDENYDGCINQGNTDVEDEDGDTKVQPDRPDSALDMCPIWTAIMIMLVIVVTKMFIVLMTRYNLTGWTQLLKCASPIFHPQHQVINVLVCGIVFLWILRLGTWCLGVCIWYL